MPYKTHFGLPAQRSGAVRRCKGCCYSCGQPAAAQAHRAAWLETAHCCPLCKTLLEQTGNWYTKGCQHKALWKRGAKLTKKQKFGRDYGYYLRYVAGKG